MPLDASIPLQVRPFQLESPVAQFGNALAIQQGMNQNALAGLQMNKLKRDFEDEEADRAAIMGAGGDLEAARNALLQRGRVKPAMELDKALLEKRKTLAQITRDEAETNLKHLGVLSSVLAPLSTKPDVTLDDVAGLLTTAQAAGVPSEVIKNIANAVPKNAMALPGFVRNLAMTTESGRKALEMALPKIEMKETAGADGRPFLSPINTNTLAGPVGPMQGAPQTPLPVKLETRDRGGFQESIDPYTGKVREGTRVAKTMTPGESARLAEDRRHHGVTEAHAAEQARQGKAQVVTDEAGNVNLVDRVTGQSRPVVDTISGQPLKGKEKLTEAQGKAGLFGSRASESDRILRGIEDNISVTGLAVKQGLEKAPWVGGALGAAGNVALSENQQKVEQAQRDFVNAILRQESGAVISPSEFDNAKKQYFPQPGDSKGVIEQKRKNREIAIAGLKVMAGPAAPKAASGGWKVEKE